MQLRYLQTLNNIATEQNSTIIFPIPVDLFSLFKKNQLNSIDTTMNPYLSTSASPDNNHANIAGRSTSTDI